MKVEVERKIGERGASFHPEARDEDWTSPQLVVSLQSRPEGQS